MLFVYFSVGTETSFGANRSSSRESRRQQIQSVGYGKRCPFRLASRPFSLLAVNAHETRLFTWWREVQNEKTAFG